MRQAELSSRSLNWCSSSSERSLLTLSLASSLSGLIISYRHAHSSSLLTHMLSPEVFFILSSLLEGSEPLGMPIADNVVISDESLVACGIP